MWSIDYTVQLTIGELALNQSPILQEGFREVDVLLPNAQGVRSDRYPQQIPDQEMASLRHECRFNIHSLLVAGTGKAKCPQVVRQDTARDMTDLMAQNTLPEVRESCLEEVSEHLQPHHPHLLFTNYAEISLFVSFFHLYHQQPGSM